MSRKQTFVFIEVSCSLPNHWQGQEVPAQEYVLMQWSGGVKSNKVILFKNKSVHYMVGMGFYVRNIVFSLICLIKLELLTTETQLQAFKNVVHEAVAFYCNILAGTRSTEQQIHCICTRIVAIPIQGSHLEWSFVLRDITSNVSKTKRKKKKERNNQFKYCGKYVPRRCSFLCSLTGLGLMQDDSLHVYCEHTPLINTHTLHFKNIY